MVVAHARHVCLACGELADAAGVCDRDNSRLAPADDDPLIGSDIAGYRIVELIGRGGMGHVYRALQRSIGAQVAIKVLSHQMARDPEVAERFIAEARIPNIVRHDGLVNIIGLGVLPDGRPYQLMEFLIGASLADLIAHHGAMPVGTLCELVREALRALIPLHELGIVHRDLKPSNLFVTTSGRLKVLDFGIAKLVRPDGRSLTRTGHMLGTPEYMAPEQAEGDAVDHCADLYALGVVLFEGVTGHRPFEGHLIEALALCELPPHVAPPVLDAVIQRAMDPDPARRFASAREMEAALAVVVETLETGAFTALDVGSVDPAPSPSTVEFPATLAEITSDNCAERLGRYIVEGILGRGGAGVVLIGFDPMIQRRVALKLLDGDAQSRHERLVAEAQAMARVNHPNVLALYELAQDLDQTFLVLEYVEGCDLARWLVAEPRPWHAVVDMFVAAGRGLAAAHAAGVVHRDFKPANVLVGDDQRPRVADFGLAASDIGGTPRYMAPEQLEGAPVDARADQFAFAAALWEALHDAPPYRGDSATALALAAQRGELCSPRRRDVPDRITRALRRALAAAPADRFATTHQLLEALETRASDRRGIVRRIERRISCGRTRLRAAGRPHARFVS